MTKRTKSIFSWILPLLLAMGAFAFVRPALAELAIGDITLIEYLTENNVEVGSDIGENGFRQIYYIYQNNKKYITAHNYTSSNPVTHHQNIVYMSQIDGTWQIFMYQIPIDSTIQLTHSGNNVNPRIDSGRIVWESWIRDSDTPRKWHIVFFDGSRILNLSQDDSTAINPDIEGDFITYTTRHPSGQWKSVAYSISQNKYVDISVGPDAKHPRLTGGQIELSPGVPVSISTLFELDLGSLGTPDTPDTVTAAEIQAELENPLISPGL